MSPINGNQESVAGRAIEFGLLGLLVFSPLPVASVHEWSILVIQLAVLAMVGFYVWMKDRPEPNEHLAKATRWPGILFLAFFVFLVVQFMPLPKFLVGFLSPSAPTYLEKYGPSFSEMKFTSLSLLPAYTFQRTLELLAYFLLGYLVLRTITRRQQIIRIYSLLVALGAFEAFYGLYELTNKSPRLLFYRKIHNLDSVTGTFVNRNHLSGYLEMILPLTIGLIISRVDLFSLRELSFRERLARFAERGLAINLLLSLAVVLMAVAIIFSKSRSGVFILVFTFILFLGFTAIYAETRGFRKKRIRRLLQVIFAIIVILSLYVGIDATLARFSLDKILEEGRPTYWANTLRTFAAYPLFGTGLGTFGALYPPMEGGAEGPVALVHAHNDYLEYLSELGAIGFLLLFGGILWMAIMSFVTWRERRHPEVKGLALGGIVAIVNILIHSLTDFNLHIPANLVLFAVLLPLTLVTAFYKRGMTSVEKDERS